MRYLLHHRLSRTDHAAASKLRSDTGGAVIVEAAIVLPILVLMMLGMITYGGWFMAAHSLQEAANAAARSAVAGLDEAERSQLVNRSIGRGVLQGGTIEPALLTVRTSRDQGYYLVTLEYDVQRSGLLQNAIVPLPGKTIVRRAVVELPTP